MRGSGLQEALKLIYADNVVPHMLSGKAISRAVRGQLLVETALNTILLSKAYDVPLPTEGERQQDRVKDSNTKDEAKEAQERDSGAETAAESETEEMHTDLKGVKDILESLMQGKTSMEYIKVKKVKDLMPCVTILSVIKLFLVNLSSSHRHFHPRLRLPSITVIEHTSMLKICFRFSLLF